MDLVVSGGLSCLSCRKTGFLEFWVILRFGLFRWICLCFGGFGVLILISDCRVLNFGYFRDLWI